MRIHEVVKRLREIELDVVEGGLSSSRKTLAEMYPRISREERRLDLCGKCLSLWHRGDCKALSVNLHCDGTLLVSI